MGAERDSTRPGDGVYRYETKQGRGTTSSTASPTGGAPRSGASRAPGPPAASASASPCRPQVGDQLSTTETFGEFFDAWLQRRRPYLEPGTYVDYEIHGRKRLAELRPLKLTKLSTATIETWLGQLAEEGRYAPKTINNALATLVACLNDATRKGKIVRNPAARIQRLPAGHLERDYLRLEEIPGYLDACSATYRPLAELLIATCLRISEGLGLTWADVDFDNGRSASCAHASAAVSARRRAIGSARSMSARAWRRSCAT